MEAARPLKKGMQFVDDDGVQRSQKPARIRRAAKKKRLDRFWRDHHYAARLFQHSLLGALGRITMPANEADAHALAQKVQPPVLIVDQGL